MRTISWLLFLMFLTATALCRQAPPAAQPQPATPTAAPAVSNTAAATNAAATNAPAQPPKKKSSKKKGTAKTTAKKKDAAAQLRTVPLMAGPAVVIASNVNVRGQAKLKSEV